MDSSSVDDDIFLAPTPKDIFTMSWAAFGAVSGTGLIVIAGAVFSAKGYLTAQSAKEISKLNLYFLTGSLMLFNLGDAITPAILRELWPIPVLVALFLFISWLLAKIGCFVLGIREHQNWVTACIAFSNNNNAPVSIIYALVFGGDAKKLQIPGQKLPKLEVLSRGLSYVFVFALFSNLVRWSYGYNLLVAKSATAAIEAEDEEVSSNNSSSSGVVPSSPPAPIPVSGPATPAYMPNHVSRTFSDRARHLEAVRRLSVGLGTDETQMDWTDEEFAAADLPNRRPNAINGRRPTSDEHRPLLGSYTAEPIDESNEQPQQEDEDETEPPTFWNRIKDSKAARIFQTLIGPFSNPPMVASLLGILFGLVAPLKGLIFGAEAPFRSLIGTPLRNCGEASVPLTLLTLGATLHKTLMRRSDLQSNHAEHAAANRKVMRAVLFVCFARLIVMAAVGVGAAFAARRYGVALALEDPLFVLVILILASSPTAVNLAQIAAVGGAHEEELSLCLLWMYGAALPLQIAVCAAYLVLVGDYMPFRRPAWAVEGGY